MSELVDLVEETRAQLAADVLLEELIAQTIVGISGGRSLVVLDKCAGTRALGHVLVVVVVLGGVDPALGVRRVLHERGQAIPAPHVEHFLKVALEIVRHAGLGHRRVIAIVAIAAAAAGRHDLLCGAAVALALLHLGAVVRLFVKFCKQPVKIVFVLLLLLFGVSVRLP